MIAVGFCHFLHCQLPSWLFWSVGLCPLLPDRMPAGFAIHWVLEAASANRPGTKQALPPPSPAWVTTSRVIRSHKGTRSSLHGDSHHGAPDPSATTAHLTVPGRQQGSWRPGSVFCATRPDSELGVWDLRWAATLGCSGGAIVPAVSSTLSLLSSSPHTLFW